MPAFWRYSPFRNQTFVSRHIRAGKYMSRLIDLSTPIREGHFRWPVDRHVAGGTRRRTATFRWTWFGMGVHGFTHMDSPRHFNPEGFTTDDISLDMVVGNMRRRGCQCGRTGRAPSRKDVIRSRRSPGIREG